MKIPLILAQEPVAVPQAPRYGGVQETGLGEVGRGLGHVAHVIGAVAEEKAKQQQATDALGLYTTFVDSLDQAEDDLKHGKRDANGTVLETPPDSRTYRGLWQQRFDEIRQTIHSDDPQTQYLVDRLIGRARIERGEQARAQANRLFLQEEGASLQTFKETWAKRLSEEPNPIQYNADKKLVETYILGKANVFGADVVERERREFIQMIEDGRARIAIRNGTFKPEDYPGLPPIRRAELTDHDLILKQRRDTQLLEDYTRAKADTLSDLAEWARAGALTKTQFTEWQRIHQFSPHEQQFIVSLIDQKAEGETDPALRHEIAQRFQNPSMSQKDLDWLGSLFSAKPPRVSRTDYEHYSQLGNAQLRQQDVERRTAKAEERADLADRRQEFHDADQRLRGMLLVQSSVAEILDTSRTNYAVAREQLYTRWKNGEDPHTVLDEMEPAFLSRNKKALSDRILALTGTLPVQTLEELGTFAEAERRYRMDRPTYNRIVRMLTEIERVESLTGIERARREFGPKVKKLMQEEQHRKQIEAGGRPSPEGLTP